MGILNKKLCTSLAAGVVMMCASAMPAHAATIQLQAFGQIDAVFGTPTLLDLAVDDTVIMTVEWDTDDVAVSGADVVDFSSMIIDFYNSVSSIVLSINVDNTAAESANVLHFFDGDLVDVDVLGFFQDFVTDVDYGHFVGDGFFNVFEYDEFGDSTLALVGSYILPLGTTPPVAVIPVPAAVWLFGSGLLGLIGIARRRRA